ncbi:hypothetical protein L218DRAFT_951450 [Marasmius fiardii PR-910]|nr:hypothetical protein L218DRAFT_951450 [Marasmius fiardii PR-910]
MPMFCTEIITTELGISTYGSRGKLVSIVYEEHEGWRYTISANVEFRAYTNSDPNTPHPPPSHPQTYLAPDGSIVLEAARGLSPSTRFGKKRNIEKLTDLVKCLKDKKLAKLKICNWQSIAGLDLAHVSQGAHVTVLSKMEHVQIAHDEPVGLPVPLTRHGSPMYQSIGLYVMLPLRMGRVVQLECYSPCMSSQFNSTVTPIRGVRENRCAVWVYNPWVARTKVQASISWAHILESAVLQMIGIKVHQGFVAVSASE